MEQNPLAKIMQDVDMALADETGTSGYPDMFTKTEEHGEIRLTFFSSNELDTLFAAVGVGEGSSEAIQEQYLRTQKEGKRLVAVVKHDGENFRIRVDELPYDTSPELFDELQKMGAFFSEK